MSKQYRRNVQAMCDRLGLPNPVREDDVFIDRIIFYFRNTAVATVHGTKMNQAGRLFLQEKFSGPGYRADKVSISKKFNEIAAAHFAELWLDADEKGRSLILAIKRSDLIILNWKPWFPEF